jgi:hypothetical protein
VFTDDVFTGDVFTGDVPADVNVGATVFPVDNLLENMETPGSGPCDVQ